MLGRVADGPSGPLLVTDAPGRAAVRRYGLRAAGFGGGGGALVGVSVPFLRSVVGLYSNATSSSVVRSPNSQSAWSTAYSRSAGWTKPSASSTTTGR